MLPMSLYESDESNGTISLHNLMGEKFYNKLTEIKNGLYELRLENNFPGIYILKVSNDSHLFLEKIIIQ